VLFIQLKYPVNPMNPSAIFMFISSFTIAIPLLIAILRFRYIPGHLYPFFSFIILCAVNECFTSIMLLNRYSNTSFNYNVYFLIESFILTYQFKLWGAFKKRVKLFPLLSCLFPVVWILESIITKVHLTLNSYFIIFYSFCMVILSIKTMNSYLVANDSRMIDNPVFIICGAFITFFTFSIISDTFLAYSFKTSDAFKWYILDILNTANIICNLLYALALLNISKRKKLNLAIVNS
jgi:hypothetical protein